MPPDFMAAIQRPATVFMAVYENYNRQSPQTTVPTLLDPSNTENDTTLQTKTPTVPGDVSLPHVLELVQADSAERMKDY